MRAIRRQKIPPSVGDELPASHRWIDGEPTDEKLLGTSGLLIRGQYPTAAELATLDDYPGEYVVVIEGEHWEQGEDPGEVVIDRAIVIAVIRGVRGKSMGFAERTRAMFEYVAENAGQGMSIGWMDAYVYQADLYCEDCGRAIQKDSSDNAEDEDSDSYPQGPYPDGGGESDSPQHCGNGEKCINAMTFDGVKVGVWLGNPLTSDGVAYLKEMLSNPNATPYQMALHEFWSDVYADYLEAPREVEETGVREGNDDFLAFNTTLAKLMQRLKKDAGAESVSQNYRGTGREAFRRQLWVRFKSGAVIDLWLDNGRLGFGGAVMNSPPGNEPKPLPKSLPYGDKTPEEVYAEAAALLKEWATPGMGVAQERRGMLESALPVQEMEAARRPRKDPTAWRSTPEGHAKYVAARDEAQRKANELGYDYGIEANDLFKSFHVFMLPSAQHRSGHELRCEVVHPMNPETTKPGHGPGATRDTMRGLYEPRGSVVHASSVTFQTGDRLRIRSKSPQGHTLEAFWYTIDYPMTLDEIALQFAQTGQPGMFLEIVSGKLKWTFRQERFAGQPAVTRVR